MKATNLPYKYPQNSTSANKGPIEKRNAVSKLGSIGVIAGKLIKGMKGIGESKNVIITWLVKVSPLPPSPAMKLVLLAGILATILRIPAAGRKEAGLQRFALTWQGKVDSYSKFL